MYSPEELKEAAYKWNKENNFFKEQNYVLVTYIFALILLHFCAVANCCTAYFYSKMTNLWNIYAQIIPSGAFFL